MATGWSVEVVETDGAVRVDFVVGVQRFCITNVDLDDQTNLIEARELCRYMKERFVHALGILGVTSGSEPRPAEMYDALRRLEGIAHGRFGTLTSTDQMAVGLVHDEMRRRLKAPAPPNENEMSDAAKVIAACMRNGQSFAGDHRIDEEWWLRCELHKLETGKK